MPENQTGESLAQQKLFKEIEKLDLEKRELNRSRRRFTMTWLSPILIAIISACVVIKSNLFQDLQIKVENDRFAFTQDTIKHAREINQIRATLARLTIDSTNLQDSIAEKSRRFARLQTIYKEYLSNEEKTLKNLSIRVVDYEEKIKDDSVRNVFNTRQNNALENYIHQHASPADAIVRFRLSILDWLNTHPINDDKSKADFVNFLGDYVGSHMEP